MKRIFILLLALWMFAALPASAQGFPGPSGGGGFVNMGVPAPSAPTTGMTLYYDGAKWRGLAAGSNTNILTLTGGVPTWAAPAASGIPAPGSQSTGSLLWYNASAWIASTNVFLGSGASDNGTIQLGKNSNSVSGVLVIQSGGATGQGVITYPGAGSANIILPTANRTGLTANPGSTLPLLISSTGVESTGALTGAQMLALNSQHVYVGNGSSQAADGGAGFVYNSSGASIVTIGVQSSSGGELVIAGNSGGFSSGNILLNGYTSGQTEITVPAVSGSAVITLATVNTTDPTAQPTTTGGVLISDTSGNRSYTNDAQFAGTSGSTLTLGLASSATGILNFTGTTSGTTALTVPAAAGGVTITLPTVATTGPTANNSVTGGVLTASTTGVQTYKSNLAVSGAQIILGIAGSATPQLLFNNVNNGTCAINPNTAAAASGSFTLPLSSGAVQQEFTVVGGNAVDGAGTIGTGTVEGQNFNYTTLTTTSGQTSARPVCVINATGVITLVGTSVLTANGAGTAQTGQGIANAGGFGATAASSIGDPGYGPGAGEGGNNTGLIGPGGGAGSAANGGNGGGVTVASGDGEGGLNGAGNSHYSGNLNGSGGGGGGSGAGGTGGNGGGGATHLTIIAAAGFTSTGSITAPGSAGAAGGTLGPGGGGGGAGTLWIYGGSGNLPACTVSAIGGAGGAGTGTSANSGGGGGGYIGGTNAGTIASATFTVTGGAAGTGGSGAAGSAGGAGLANMIASKAPTLPAIVYDQMNGDSAGKDMCWTLIARKGLHATHTHCDIHLVPQHFEYQPELTASGYVTHRAEYREARYEHFGDCQDIASENSHIFIWDGEKGQAGAPLSYVAATYAAPGKFSELCMALHFGGDASTASLCDSSNRDQCVKMFDTFKDSPIKGEMPIIDSTCDDTEFLRPSV